MKVFDLTQCICESMQVYPDTKAPKLDECNSYAADGFRETYLQMSSHTGTHMDAPAHMNPSAKTLDMKEASEFCGRAYVLDCRGKTSISTAMLQNAELSDADFLLLCTGQDSKWGHPDYFEGFPVLTEDAAEYAASLGLKGIGVDAISVDPVCGTDFPVHNILFANDMVSVENLCGLERFCGKTVFFAALPLSFENSDGSPVRAIIIEA